MFARLPRARFSQRRYRRARYAARHAHANATRARARRHARARVRRHAASALLPTSRRVVISLLRERQYYDVRRRRPPYVAAFSVHDYYVQTRKSNQMLFTPSSQGKGTTCCRRRWRGGVRVVIRNSVTQYAASAMSSSGTRGAGYAEWRARRPLQQ